MEMPRALAPRPGLSWLRGRRCFPSLWDGGRSIGVFLLFGMEDGASVCFCLGWRTERWCFPSLWDGGRSVGVFLFGMENGASVCFCLGWRTERWCFPSLWDGGRSDSSHPGSQLFDLLPSGRRYRCIKARTNRLKNSFFPRAITTLSSHRSHTKPTT
uniref:Uncharacterized protein n=1 Tax=Amphiprion percula TaxID=161767 RepID=A0A3P8SN94_AMPPE